MGLTYLSQEFTDARCLLHTINILMHPVQELCPAYIVGKDGNPTSMGTVKVPQL